MQASEMWAADKFVASLVVMREEDDHRRAARRRRRVDYIAEGDKERLRSSNEGFSNILRRNADTMPLIEQDLRKSLGNMGSWWDLVSTHILEEEREYKEAVALQKELTSMYLASTMKRETTEQSSFVSNDERRLQELMSFCILDDCRVKGEVVREVVETILASVDESIDFLEGYGLVNSLGESLFARMALASFIRRTNRTPLMDSDMADITFATIFGCHPFHMTDGTFVQLLHTMYAKLNPRTPTVSCFDICHVPLFLMTGSKLSGKTLVSQQVAADLSLLYVSDLDLVNRAIEAYRVEQNALPTLLTVEDSAALPVLNAYEERNEEEEEVVYHSHSRIVQTVESIVRLSPWASIGATIESDLLRGDCVDSLEIVKLMQLQMADPPEGCCGILFDGTVTDIEGLHALQGVIPKKVHPFEGALRKWPSPSLPLPPTEVIQTQVNEEEGALVPEPLDNLLVVRREVRPVRPAAKAEGKSKPPKKGVDYNALPPPVLPEVVRPELTPEEREAIEHWEQSERTFSLLSAVLQIRCSARETFSRFAGLRIDRETGDQYHMVYCPPPPERAPYIVNADRTRTTTVQLHRAVLKQEEEWHAMRRLLLQNGERNDIIHEIEGERVVKDIVADVKHVLLVAKDDFLRGIQMYHAAIAAKEKRSSIEKSIAEQEAQREAERTRLIEIYTESGAPIPPALDSQPPLPPFYTMPDDLPEAFMRVLTIFMKRYEEAYCWVGVAIELLIGNLLDHRCVSINTFECFWSQSDEKQEKLDQFLENYNRLPVVLLGHTSCKEELHLMVDRLKEELFHMVETTGKEAGAKVDQITRRDFFVGPWCGLVYSIGISAVQTEIERFLATLNLVAMYFGSLVNLPSIFEELDFEALATRSVAEITQEQAKGKEKKAQNTKKSLRLEDMEKNVEEVFADVISKLIVSLENYVEKISSIATASAKVRESGKASAALADDGRTALILAKCLPFAHGELASVQKRISYLQQFFSQIMHEGETYCAGIRDHMLKCTKEKQFNQAAAVNTAIFFIRNAIEEERPLTPIYLGRETFHLLPVTTESAGMQSSASQHPTSPFSQKEEPRIHATLSASRLLEIVRLFRTIAPDYALGHEAFFYIVRSADYAGAAATNTKIGRLKTREEVFASFDVYGCGLIDWREFVLHLLLWCAPSPEKKTSATENFFVNDCSVIQLIETREKVGLDMMEEEDFYSMSFFFSKCLSPERLRAYMHVLWMTFVTKEGLLDPLPLLVMLCTDQQPVRGVQKLFYILSSAEKGVLTPEGMELAFHVHVTNPRNMCISDPFSRENIAALYNDTFSLSFQSVCEKPMGRSMLNSTKLFQRKYFVTDVPNVE